MMNLNDHKFLMLLCCLIPIALFVIVFVFGFNLSPYLPFLILLLCPILHIFMMKGMHKEDANKGLGGNAEEKNKEGKGNKKESCH